jgi:hypothetical protein
LKIRGGVSPGRANSKPKTDIFSMFNASHAFSHQKLTNSIPCSPAYAKIYTEIVGGRIIWDSILILTTFLQDQDIFVASFPKSGTTWLQQVVYLLFHPDNPDSELMEWKFPYLEHVYPGKIVLFLTCRVGF